MGGAPEPIELPDDQGIAGTKMREGLRQAGPLGAGARSAVLEDLPAARGLEGILLQVEALILGADARIADLVPGRSRRSSGSLFCSGRHARESHGYADFATQIAGRKTSMFPVAPRLRRFLFRKRPFAGQLHVVVTPGSSGNARATSSKSTWSRQCLASCAPTSTL